MFKFVTILLAVIKLNLKKKGALSTVINTFFISPLIGKGQKPTKISTGLREKIVSQEKLRTDMY